MARDALTSTDDVFRTPIPGKSVEEIHRWKGKFVAEISKFIVGKRPLFKAPPLQKGSKSLSYLFADKSEQRENDLSKPFTITSDKER